MEFFELRKQRTLIERKIFLASFLSIAFRQKKTIQLRKEAESTDEFLQGLKTTTINVPLFIMLSSLTAGK